MSDPPTSHQLRHHPELAVLYALELLAELAARALTTSGPPAAPDLPYWVCDELDEAELIAADILELLSLLLLDIRKYCDCIHRR